MQLYLNYGRYWWLASPLLLLGLLSDIFMYIYWGVFVILTLNLIFERTPGPIDSLASSVNVFNQATRVNWLNIGIAIYLAFSNILIILIGLKIKVILIAIFWGLGALLLRKYLNLWLTLVHRQGIITYLSIKIPDISKAKINEMMTLYFPEELPKSKPLQSRFDLTPEQAEKVIHYYDRYLLNNYSNAAV